ncbi:hypothetical protein GE061_009459 [Apolygus lucorum]|uniref:Uncharacterized protein n=1 Tax=Apolygus lucorum TaxID=248454 RepID=A0A8S9Y2Y7_APOLU|nr:hypothetical protein GE061_009459 [Apolygus lucorum]
MPAGHERRRRRPKGQSPLPIAMATDPAPAAPYLPPFPSRFRRSWQDYNVSLHYLGTASIFYLPSSMKSYLDDD